MASKAPPPAYLRVGKRRVRIPRRRGVRIALGLWLTIVGALPIPPGYVFVLVGLAIPLDRLSCAAPLAPPDNHSRRTMAPKTARTALSDPAGEEERGEPGGLSRSLTNAL